VRTELTEPEVSLYRTNGFLVVPDLLSPGELATWRETVDAAVAERGDRLLPETPEDEPVSQPTEPITEEERAAAEYYKTVFTQRVNLWQTNEKMRRLMLDERLGKLAADLTGVEGIRMWHDHALIKEPYGNFTAYHRDNPYHSYSSPNEISVWVALDDATHDNGCLYYLPGSHKAQNYDSAGIGEDLGALFEVCPDLKDVAPVACPVPAGGACFHNGRTVHGAGANMTHGQRRAMVCILMADGSTFNGQSNILPPAYLATLQVGDVLMNDEQNPLIFSRA
jgi:ectoine hydroxylase-related dioxygenase (phytanoyl-CoA dioxygenase family)